eukprot:jgi/Astpho2/4959/Aster-06694
MPLISQMSVLNVPAEQKAEQVENDLKKLHDELPLEEQLSALLRISLSLPGNVHALNILRQQNGINTILSQLKQPAARQAAQQTAQAAATQRPTVPQELTSAVLWCLLVAMEDTSVSGAVLRSQLLANRLLPEVSHAVVAAQNAHAREGREEASIDLRQMERHFLSLVEVLAGNASDAEKRTLFQDCRASLHTAAVHLSQEAEAQISLLGIMADMQQVSTEWLSHMWDMMRGRLLADAAAAVINHKDSPEIFCKAVDLLQVLMREHHDKPSWDSMAAEVHSNQFDEGISAALEQFERTTSRHTQDLADPLHMATARLLLKDLSRARGEVDVMQAIDDDDSDVSAHSRFSRLGRSGHVDSSAVGAEPMRRGIAGCVKRLGALARSGGAQTGLRVLGVCRAASVQSTQSSTLHTPDFLFQHQQRGFAAAGTVTRVDPADIEHATGIEREELEAASQGKDLFAEDWINAPWGTEDKPVEVTSSFTSRVVGVPDPYDDSIIWWGTIKEGEPPTQIVEDGEYFVLKRIPDSDAHGGH